MEIDYFYLPVVVERIEVGALWAVRYSADDLFGYSDAVFVLATQVVLNPLEMKKTLNYLEI
jgi:hypothetical protein